MSPTDILDVTGATYTYLVNGQPPAATGRRCSGLASACVCVSSTASSMSIFDVRIPGLPMSVVQTDGNDIEPVEVDEFRIGTAETYDVIVQPKTDRAFTIFAQAMDRSGFARGTLAPRAGMAAAVPAMDPRPVRTMADMGMGGIGQGGMGGMDKDEGRARHGGDGHGPGIHAGSMDHGAMPGMDMSEGFDGGMNMAACRP